MNEWVIQAKDVTKTFPGGVVAVSALDLQVERGTFYGLIGPNGAGKTTCLRLLMGLLRPDHGTARVLGADMSAASRAIRARVAYISQAQHLPGWMTLSDLFRYVSHFYDGWDDSYAREFARRWGLVEERRIAQLSHGEQRKAAIIAALASRPEVLLLDEPAAGLDPIARRELIEELVSHMTRADGCTVLFSTHIISDLERVAESIGIMDRGRLMCSSRLDDLQSNTRRIQIIFDGDAPPPRFTVPGSLSCRISGPVLSAVTRIADTEYIESLRRTPGLRVQVFPLGLEEIFIELLSHGRREQHRQIPESTAMEHAPMDTTTT